MSETKMANAGEVNDYENIKRDAAAWRAAQGVEVGEFKDLLRKLHNLSWQDARTSASDERSQRIHDLMQDAEDAFRAQAAALLAAERERDEAKSDAADMDVRVGELDRENRYLGQQLDAATAESVRLAGEVEAATARAENAEDQLGTARRWVVEARNALSGYGMGIDLTDAIKQLVAERDALRRAVDKMESLSNTFEAVPSKIVKQVVYDANKALAPAQAPPHADGGTAE
jgi:chromosome segregation ATPase